jgi:hypothetical protein
LDLAEVRFGQGDDDEAYALLDRVARDPAADVGHCMLVAELLAERVAGGAESTVDGPARRNDRLLVGDDEIAGLLWLAHQVYDALLRFEAEGEVDLGPPVVHMRRHGVPPAVGGQVGDAQDGLAALDPLVVDELVDRALVGGALLARATGVASARVPCRVGWLACAGVDTR